jgi:hypothetical protein
MKTLLCLLSALLLSSVAPAGNLPTVQTVFVILLENHNWADIKDNPSAPYLNHTLLPMASYCEQYYNPPGLHPSLPNYLWLETGTNFGIFDDNNPADDHQAATNHLVSLLNRAGISWRAYQEDIMAGYVLLEDTNNYAVRHNPFVYFDDVTGTNNPNYAYGIAHIRPYTELAADLTNNTAARYNFITPNVINDGHDSVPPDFDAVRQMDDWLATEIPKILRSSAYSNNGAIFITWDEGEDAEAPDGPIGMIVLSPLARGGGYFNRIHYTHSSYVRTMQEIFGVSPWLDDAANATNLSDLFMPLSIQPASPITNRAFRLNITGVVPGRTNFVEASTNLTVWTAISTNYSSSNSFFFMGATATNGQQFYRVREAQ